MAVTSYIGLPENFQKKIIIIVVNCKEIKHEQANTEGFDVCFMTKLSEFVK